MRVVTAAQMREIETSATRDWGIPALLLMENAAVKTVPHILRAMNDANKRVTILCGPGNNGGDGFAVARLLRVAGAEPYIVCVGGSDGIVSEGAAGLNRDIVRKMGIPLYSFPEGNKPADGETDMRDAASREADAQSFVRSLLRTSAVTVDALFGTGLSREADGSYAALIHIINACAKIRCSLDIPSGVDADTGRVLGCAVRADFTVSYGFMKPGLLLYPGAEHAGRVFVEDISLPRDMPANGRAFVTLTDKEIPALLPSRPAFSHKGRFGRVCVLAGSRDMPGAAALCCLAAYRAGAGLVDACVTDDVARVIANHVPEAIATRLPARDGVYGPDSREALAGRLHGVLVLGPGIGRGADVTDFVYWVLENTDGFVVLDADGLNAVAEDVSVLKKIHGAITPHPGEMSRLMRVPTRAITDDPVGAACTFAAEYRTTVLLKGARTVIAAPQGPVYINTTGNASLAKAGSGDVLAGMIAGLLAQDVGRGGPSEAGGLAAACTLGAFLHGKAGALAGETRSLYGVNARDIAETLPAVMAQYAPT